MPKGSDLAFVTLECGVIIDNYSYIFHSLLKNSTYDITEHACSDGLF